MRLARAGAALLLLLALGALCAHAYDEGEKYEGKDEYGKYEGEKGPKKVKIDWDVEYHAGKPHGKPIKIELPKFKPEGEKEHKYIVKEEKIKEEKIKDHTKKPKVDYPKIELPRFKPEGEKEHKYVEVKEKVHEKPIKDCTEKPEVHYPKIELPKFKPEGEKEHKYVEVKEPKYIEKPIKDITEPYKHLYPKPEKYDKKDYILPKDDYYGGDKKGYEGKNDEKYTV